MFGWFDRLQRRYALIGLPLALRQKYSEDQGSYLAATIAYYGFFSIFPLLLVLTTGLGFVLRGHPHLENQVIGTALGQFPVIGTQLRSHSLNGSSLALTLGIVGALWAGMGCVLAAQSAMDQLWGVPFTERPNFLRSRARAVFLLCLLGGGLLVTAALAGIGTVGASYGLVWKVVSVVASTLLDVGLFWLAFRLLTVQEVSWRELRVGAIAAGIGYEVVQLFGGLYVGHVVANASNVYGTFALVIGLLSFIYLSVHVTLLAAELNVVVSKRLWPRSFSLLGLQPPTSADRMALTQRTQVEARREDERIDVLIPVDQGESSVPSDT